MSAGGFSEGLKRFKSSEERGGATASTLRRSTLPLQQNSADGVSSKRNRLAWGDSRKFSLSSGSSDGAAHLEPEILSLMMATESGLRHSCHSQGWLKHSTALGRSLVMDEDEDKDGGLASCIIQTKTPDRESLLTLAL